MNRIARIAAAGAVCLAVGSVAGCRNVPEDASTKDFCSKGEKFSASTTFEAGVKAADKLAEVGTPKGIPKDARDGFVELIDRVTDAKNGADFKKKAAKLSTKERKHLEALSSYIQKTCDLS